MSKIYNLLYEKDSKIVDTPEASLSASQTDLKARKALDSVDDQIDALILRYEASSIREVPTSKLDESLRNSSLAYLIEQDEAEDDAAGAPPEAGDEPAGDNAAEAPEPVGSEKMDVDEPGKQLIPDLDIDAFAARTVRLLTNYKSLLRMEEAILNRVKHFLDENYGENFVQSYVEILDRQYGISLSEFEDVRKTVDEPFAVGAFAGGTGGLGGGGG